MKTQQTTNALAGVMGALVIAVAAFAPTAEAATGWPFHRHHAHRVGKDIHTTCDRPDCREVRIPANGKSGPIIIRCRHGKPCHPMCTHRRG